MLVNNNSNYKVYAAVDFGSGALKVQAVVVDQNTNQMQKPFFSRYEMIALMEDVLRNNGVIGDQIQTHAMQVLRDVKAEVICQAKEAGHLSIEFITGVATAVFRKALNGAEFLNKIEAQLGMSFKILSQEQEGVLGFMNACILCPEIPQENLVAWDSGSGSFQMTAKANNQYQTFNGPLGQGTIRVLLSRDVKNWEVLGVNESGGPVSRHEAEFLMQKIKALLPVVPSWLKEKLKKTETNLVSFGDGESIFLVTAHASEVIKGNKIAAPLQEATLFLADVWNVVEYYLDKSDEFFLQSGVNVKTLTSAIQLATVMDHCGVDKMLYRRSLGNTPGIIYSHLTQSENIA